MSEALSLLIDDLHTQVEIAAITERVKTRVARDKLAAYKKQHKALVLNHRLKLYEHKALKEQYDSLLVRTERAESIAMHRWLTINEQRTVIEGLEKRLSAALQEREQARTVDAGRVLAAKLDGGLVPSGTILSLQQDGRYGTDDWSADSRGLG
jgi:hypothetical protein